MRRASHSVLPLQLHFAQAPAYFMPNLCSLERFFPLSLLTAVAGNVQVAVARRLLAAPGLGSDAWTGKEGSPPGVGSRSLLIPHKVWW